MNQALFNLLDKDGIPWAQEKWTWNDRIEGYKIEIRYFQGTEERAFVEAGQANANKKRELLTWIT